MPRSYIDSMIMHLSIRLTEILLRGINGQNHDHVIHRKTKLQKVAEWQGKAQCLPLRLINRQRPRKAHRELSTDQFDGQHSFAWWQGNTWDKSPFSNALTGQNQDIENARKNAGAITQAPLIVNVSQQYHQSPTAQSQNTWWQARQIQAIQIIHREIVVIVLRATANSCGAVQLVHGFCAGEKVQSDLIQVRNCIVPRRENSSGGQIPNAIKIFGMQKKQRFCD